MYFEHLPAEAFLSGAVGGSIDMHSLSSAPHQSSEEPDVYGYSWLSYVERFSSAAGRVYALDLPITHSSTCPRLDSFIISWWRRVPNENRRRNTWRCFGRWPACLPIGNALIAISAARPTPTWQWARLCAPPVPEYCKFLTRPLIFTQMVYELVVFPQESVQADA